MPKTSMLQVRSRGERGRSTTIDRANVPIRSYPRMPSRVLQPDGGWKLLRTTRAWDEIWTHRIDRRAGRAWLHSNLGRDKSALVEVDLATGAERVLGKHPEVDISATQLPPINGAPVSYVTHAGLPRVTWLDQPLGKEVGPGGAPGQQSRPARRGPDCRPHAERSLRHAKRGFAGAGRLRHR
jgi:hypothetical protein